MISRLATILSTCTLAVAAGSALLTPAHAQVYRIVGPDGKVTFSDKPPPPAANAKVSNESTGAGGGTAGASLPFELRQVASKYPVTLYTSDNCGPCASARSMLITRGIPFAEKTVTSAEDSQALQRLSGDNNLPFATIGGQQLKGFSDSEWTQFLNAAGYPASSILPASYRQAPATPLVAISAAPTGARTGAAATAARPATPAAPPPVAAPANNPAGIKF
jgi:glutaredoxin